MLRCIKWLPLACVALFLVCGFIGYKLVPDRQVVVAPQVKTSITFRAYDVNGKEIAAYAKDSKGVPLGRLPQHLEKYPGESDTIMVTPDDTAHFKTWEQKVDWLKPESYPAWLHGTFIGVTLINTKGVDAARWHDALYNLDHSLGQHGYDYPIILERK